MPDKFKILRLYVEKSEGDMSGKLNDKTRGKQSLCKNPNLLRRGRREPFMFCMKIPSPLSGPPPWKERFFH